MILIAGISDETPVSQVIEALEGSGAEYRVFDQRGVAAVHMTLEIGDAAAGGARRGSNWTARPFPCAVSPDSTCGRWTTGLLPEIVNAPVGAPQRLHARRLHELLLAWADLMPGRVLNRPTAMASNQSKPYQAQIIREVGFGIAETCITNDPDAARAFIARIWGKAAA